MSIGAKKRAFYYFRHLIQAGLERLALPIWRRKGLIVEEIGFKKDLLDERIYKMKGRMTVPIDIGRLGRR